MLREFIAEGERPRFGQGFGGLRNKMEVSSAEGQDRISRLRMTDQKKEEGMHVKCKAELGRQEAVSTTTGRAQQGRSSHPLVPAQPFIKHRNLPLAPLLLFDHTFRARNPQYSRRILLFVGRNKHDGEFSWPARAITWHRTPPFAHVLSPCRWTGKFDSTSTTAQHSAAQHTLPAHTQTPPHPRCAAEAALKNSNG